MMNRAATEIQESPDTEIMGSMLAGLVQALKHVHVLSGEKAAGLVKDIESNSWYPMSIFFALLQDLDKFEVDPAPILFQAGNCFVRDWYEHGGNHVVTCAANFLRMQGNSIGYSMAHRGGADKLGRLDLVEFDESAGHARLVCITPYPSDFERGLFYGGILLAGDVDYVHIETVEEPYNRYLNKKTHTIRLHKKPDAATNNALDDYLSRLDPAAPVAIPANVQEAMVWRLKALAEQHAHDLRFHEQSSLLLSKAASQVCVLSAHLDRLAHRDALTDLLNRRAILEDAQNIFALAARNGSSVGFIMVDIDFFKSVNDTWGHEAGDETLRHVATVLKNNLRDSDILGRMGGEEFLIVLPETDLEGARVVAEKLRTAVEEQGQPLQYKSAQPLTISLGVAAINAPSATHDCQHCIRQADHALYQSKQNGRNRVTVFSGN